MYSQHLAIDETLERMSGDVGLMTSLFELYLSDTPKKMVELDAALAAGDCYRVERLAHSVKGAAATVGAQLVLPLAADLEKAAKAENPSLMHALLDRLKETSAETMTAMKEYAASL